MEPARHEGEGFEALNMAVLPGSAALHGLKQLIRELEPLIGEEAAERVREKVEQPIKSSNLPKNIEDALTHGLR